MTEPVLAVMEMVDRDIAKSQAEKAPDRPIEPGIDVTGLPAETGGQGRSVRRTGCPIPIALLWM